MIPCIPLHGIFTGLRHMTLYASTSRAINLMMGVLRKRKVKYGLRRVLCVAQKTEGIVFTGFYSKSGISASMWIMAGKTAKPLMIHPAFDKGITLNTILMGISICPHLLRILSR